jgi:N-acetylglucosaminyl-diphospho-decaprenol L-rhamnosyltransferase
MTYTIPAMVFTQLDAMAWAPSESPGRVRPSIAVIILNYRTAALTIDCVASLAGQIDPDMQVIVVDNDSGDGSADQIERFIEGRGLDKRFTVLRSPVNGGFAAGNNLGIRAVDAGAYLLLNSDTIVRPGAIASLRDAMRRRPDAGIIAPRLEAPDGTPQDSAFRAPTPATELIRAARTGLVTRLLRRHDVVLPREEEPAEAEWVAFACVLIRSEVVERIGPLDEGYFMYFEDIDYCRRAREAGFKVLYWPLSRVAHIAGASSDITPARRKRAPRYFYEARSRYYGKFHGRTGLLLANLLFSAGRTLSAAREALGRSPHLCEEESRDIWTNWLAPFKTSAAIPPNPGSLARGDHDGNPPGIGILDLWAEDYRTFDRNLLEPGFWAIALHRFGNWRMGLEPRVVRAPLSIAYKVGHTSINWLWGIDLAYTVKLGRRVRLWHHGGMVLVAHSIGDDVVIRHNTTMGIARLTELTKRPTIEDRVEIGAGVCILGEVRIGHDSVIGANAVVLKSFPPHSTIAGVPARAVGNGHSQHSLGSAPPESTSSRPPSS